MRWWPGSGPGDSGMPSNSADAARCLDEFRGVCLRRASSSAIRFRALPPSSSTVRTSAAREPASSACRETGAASISSLAPASSPDTQTLLRPGHTHHAIPHHRRTCSAHAHNTALNGTDQLQIEMDGEVVISYTISLEVAGRFRAACMPLGIYWPFRQRPRTGRYRHPRAESGTEDAIYLDWGG